MEQRQQNLNTVIRKQNNDGEYGAAATKLEYSNKKTE